MKMKCPYCKQNIKFLNYSKLGEVTSISGMSRPEITRSSVVLCSHCDTILGFVTYSGT